MTFRFHRAWAIAPAALLLAASAVAVAQPPGRGPAPAAQSNAPTPRTADGKPDLTGYWGPPPAPGGGGPGAFATGPNRPDENGDYISPMNLRNGDMSNLTNDGVIARRNTNNLPLYKPEHWAKVEDLDYNGNVEDPFNHCMPPGVPRIGAPRRIILMKDEVHFFYTTGFQRNDFRSVPIGPRTEQPDRDGTWSGVPVARWDGDTLVVETYGFNDAAWLGPQGYIHGYELKVTERFTLNGDRLTYQSTVEDPDFLQRPWVREPTTLARITTPGYRIAEAPPCSDRDVKHQVGKQREM